MTKSSQKYLALKGVRLTEDNRFVSSHVTSPFLRETYKVGETNTAKHKKLPFYIGALEDIYSFDGKTLITFSCHQKILLVVVEARNLTRMLPFGTFNVSDASATKLTLEAVLKDEQMKPRQSLGCCGTTKLQVLEVVPENINLFEYLGQMGAKLHLPILSTSVAPTPKERLTY